MEETLVQGHTGAGMEPGFIPGLIDTKAQLFRLLSPLSCPAPGPRSWDHCLETPCRQKFSPPQGHSARWTAESQPHPQAKVTAISQMNPWQPLCKLKPRVTENLPKVT